MTGLPEGKLVQRMDGPRALHSPFNEKAEGTDGFVRHQTVAGGVGGDAELLRLQQQFQHVREVGEQEGKVVLVVPVLREQKTKSEVSSQRDDKLHHYCTNTLA